MPFYPVPFTDFNYVGAKTRHKIIKAAAQRLYTETGITFNAISDDATRTRAIRRLARQVQLETGCGFKVAEQHVLKLIKVTTVTKEPDL